MTPWAKSNSTYSNPIGGSLAQRSRTKSHGTASEAEGWGSLLAVNDAAAIIQKNDQGVRKSDNSKGHDSFKWFGFHEAVIQVINDYILKNNDISLLTEFRILMSLVVVEGIISSKFA